MKIKFVFYVVAVVFVVIVDFSQAKNEQKRRRPIIDSAAQDSDGNYFDQLALDSVSHTSTNVVTAPENYPSRYHSASDEIFKPAFQKFSSEPKVSFSSEPKVSYITPEPYKNNFSHDLVHHPTRTHDKFREKSPASSFPGFSVDTRNEPKKTPTVKRKKIPSSEYEDYNYYFPESKRINSRPTEKPAAVKDVSEKYYKPQSPGAVIKKDQKASGDDTVNTYHYYYPDEASSNEKLLPNHFDFPTTTFAPSTTKAPRSKFSSKKKTPSMQLEHASTDSYQYQPVLQRPSEYTPTDNSHQNFIPAYSTYESKNYGTRPTPAPATPSPIKMLKPTKKNLYYLPSSTMSPTSTARPMRVRRPSTETPYVDVKQFSVSPSPSTMPHYSTTRAPEVFKYSTKSPVSSTTFRDFYIKPSTQATPSASPSPSDLASDGSERTIVIRPKTQYQNFDSYELPARDSIYVQPSQEPSYEQSSQEPSYVLPSREPSYELPSREPTYDGNYEQVKERIIYKFVPEETYYDSNKTDGSSVSYSTPATFADSLDTPDFYNNLNQSTQADMDFYNKFHKDYNYEYFTEKDAGQMQREADDETMKMDHSIYDTESFGSKQTATKKNMMYQINPQHEFNSSPYMPTHLEDHEMPPPLEHGDNDAEASKNQYFVLYSIDEEEKRQKKQQQKKKQKQEPEVQYHHHHHQHDEKVEDFQHFDTEFDGEFDSELTNTENVRIVDPAVRGGRPLEFTKDDYLRHIKQAVVQYMKDYQPKDSTGSTSNIRQQKHQRYQDAVDAPYRPTKTPAAATTASSYKHNLPPQQYKAMSPLKLPKNVYTAGRLKDAIDELQESPQIDLTVKKSKQKPFDLSAIDVGQSYQHGSHFDHSAALKNTEEFDQSNVMNQQKKLQFTQQTYHDINNLSYNQKQKHKHTDSDDSENDSQSPNFYKNYMLPNKYSMKGNQNIPTSYSAMSYDGSKLPRIVTQHGHDDDDEDDNKLDDPVDAPIQIINGIPVANPYNIDLNTLKYMLGGIAQAEVNDQLKDLDESPSSNTHHKYPANWKNFSPSQLGSFTSNNPMYQVYGQQNENGQRQNENGQRQKKNSGQTGNYGISSSQQQSKYPLVGSLLNYNKGKNQNSNKQKNLINAHKNNQNYGLSDFSGWNQLNKKQRSEPQTASSNSHFVLRPVMKNKHASEMRPPPNSPINRLRHPQLSTDMRPPPPIKPKSHLLIKKVN